MAPSFLVANEKRERQKSKIKKKITTDKRVYGVLLRAQTTTSDSLNSSFLNSPDVWPEAICLSSGGLIHKIQVITAPIS